MCKSLISFRKILCFCCSFLIILHTGLEKGGTEMQEEIDCGTCVYKCKKCTISFARAKDAIYNEKNCGNCICQTCEKTFPNQVALRKHVNIHKETYKCEVYQKLFQTRYMLTRHQKVHDKRKDFSCTCCNANFSIKSNLNRHYKNAHDKQ